MKTKLTHYLMAALLGGAFTFNLHAQLVPDGGSLVVTTPTDISPSNLTVGTNAGNTMLTILSPGTVTNATGYIGYNATSDNNQVRVENSGAVWQNTGTLNVGTAGSGNQLMVSNGGVVADTFGQIGNTSTANNNLAVVRDAGSLWNNSISLYVGAAGSGNQLVVSNGAVVASAYGILGSSSSVSNNLAVVTGAGSLWANSGFLYVGQNGSENQLVASDAGTIQAADAYLGLASSSINNRVTVDGGNLIVTNSAGTAVLDIRRGTNVFNAGLIQADNLLVTNSTGFFEFNGGTLITGGGTVNNGQPFVVGASGTNTATLDLGSGAMLTLNNGFTLGANTAPAGNQLLVTNGGTLSVAGTSYVSVNGTASNNLVTISGPNSLWTNSGALMVGYVGSGNQLMVTNGGVVDAAAGQIGYAPYSSSNLAVVSGAGSLWTNSGDINVGTFGNGNQLVVSNGGVVANLDVGRVGYNVSASNNLAMVTGAGSLWTSSAGLYVGQDGSGNQLLVSNEGTVQTAILYAGKNASSTNNRVTVDGGNLIVTNSGGTGTLDIRHGTNVFNAGLIQADNLLLTNSAGFFEFNGGTLIAGGGTVSNGQPFVVGANGANTAILDLGSGAMLTLNNGFTLGANTAPAGNQLLLTNGGTLNLAGTSYVGVNGTGSNNLVTISGPNSLWTNSAHLYFGLVGSGNQLVVSNGAVVANAGVIVGRYSESSNNVAVVTGTGSLLTNTFLYVGYSGGGNQLVVNSGGVVASTSGYIGLNSSSDNNLAVVTGAGSLWTNSGDFVVGNTGSGNQLVVSNGAVVADGFAYIAPDSSSSNNVAVVTGTGSLWTNTGDCRVGDYGSGNQLVVSNGGAVVSGIGYLGVNSGASDNLAVVTGTGSLLTNTFLYVGFSGGGNQLVVNSGGVVASTSGYIGELVGATNNVTVVTGTGSQWNISATLAVGDSGSGNQLVVTNGGTVQAANAVVGFQTGSTNNRVTLDGGTVTVTGSLTINSNNMLAGSGTINGTVINYGSLAPGNPIGKLVLNSSPALQGSVVMEIGKTGATLTNDQIQVAAPLTYGGNLVVSNVGPTALSVGDSFQLFSATSYDGAFTGMSLPSPGSGLMWTNQLLLNGSIAVVAQVPPSISSLVKSGTNLMFNVSGGSPGGAYDVLTSTNVALPLSSWATNSTGNFDWMGNATLTNGIDPADPQRFFTISAH